MARRTQSKGPCAYCAREFSGSAMTRHLGSCRSRATAIGTGAGGRPERTLHHLRVGDRFGYGYWLHLEMDGDAALEELDGYLRAIWLQCCWHLSSFQIGEVEYSDVDPEDVWGDREVRSLEVTADEAFEPGSTWRYQYDFGSTTDLSIRVLGTRFGQPTTAHPIALMARNNPVAPGCQACDRPAEYVCQDCNWGRPWDPAGFVCAEHLSLHAQHEGRLPVVNSPRVGVCAYDGPAEPPY